MSDHQGSEFDLEQQCQAVDKGRGSEGRSPSWNTRQLCRERLRVHLATTRLIDELGWVEPAGSLEHTALEEEKGCHSLRLLDASPQAQASQGLDVLVK